MYGPWFRTVERLWLGVDELFGELKLAADSLAELDAYTLHPGLLDGALQVAAGAALADSVVQTEPRLPFNVERVEVLSPLAEKVFVHIRCHAETGAEIVLVDEQGRVCVRLSGYLTRAARDLLADICFTPSWIEKSSMGTESGNAREIWLVSGEPTLLEAALKSEHPQAHEIRVSGVSGFSGVRGQRGSAGGVSGVSGAAGQRSLGGGYQRPQRLVCGAAESAAAGFDLFRHRSSGRRR